MSSPGFNSTTSRYKAFCYTNDDGPTLPDCDRMDHIPDHNNAMDSANEFLTTRPDPRLNCCCGRASCAYLEHNNAALGDIEKDLEKAARLGQALLTRHESYISESQVENARLSTLITELEADRSSLQSANEKIVAENKELLAKLETLNTVYVSTDGQVKGLENLLRDCEVEVRRLHGLARRAEELEMQVLEMDKQKATLARKINDGEQETRSTLMRWRESERRLKELEVEVQKIEWEARQERERHEEAVARLERERVLERELGGAEGRLKGAAAVQDINGPGGNTKVVSHFVRDILQDNANLQAGIVEMRELLQTSNEEVQNLRSQIMQHQPMDDENNQDELTRSASLDEQLGWNEPSPAPPQREVHVHHHYHAKLTPKRDRTPTTRRVSRRRGFVAPGLPGSTPESSVPSTPVSRPQRYTSSPIIPISLNHPQPKKNRWSMQSSATMSSNASSLPSSPRSYYERNTSIFDRIELGEESSRPTSPESAVGFASPAWEARTHKLLKGDYRLNTFEKVLEGDDETADAGPTELVSDVKETPSNLDAVQENNTSYHDLTPKPSQFLQPSAPIDDLQPEPRPPDQLITTSEANEMNHEVLQTETPTPTPTPTQTATAPSPPSPSSQVHSQSDFNFDIATSIPPIRPSLHRSSSHDSLVSISGMDIHIHVSKHPSTSPFTLLRGNAAHFARPPSTARAISTAAAPPVATVTEFTAVPSSAIALTPSRSVSMSLEALSGIASAGLPTSSPSPSGLGRLVGGWVRGNWGIAPVKSIGDLRAQAQTQPPMPVLKRLMPMTTPSVRSASTSGDGSMGQNFAGERPPGINQKGPIPGFWVPTKAPSEIHPKVLDEEGLKEILAE